MEDIPDEPTPKRRRVALACSACRSRKSKCDGSRPACRACISHGYECEYDPSDAATSLVVRNERVLDLEDRVRRVEQALRRVDDVLTGHLSACSGNDGSRYGNLREDRPSKTPVAHGSRLEASALEEPETDDSGTDGLAISFVNEKTSSAFFGETSNIAFARHLLRAASVIYVPTTVGGTTTTSSDEALNGKRRLHIAKEISPALFEHDGRYDLAYSTMPPGIEMEDMMDVYFDATGSLFPFLHEPTFRATYCMFRATGFRRISRTWLGLLNMVFAMASHVNQGDDTSSKQHREQARTYYSRAKGLCNGPAKRTLSLETVQYLLLVVLYLQGARRSNETWGLYGLLVRNAMAMGLHSEQAVLEGNSIKREECRRTWLTIYCLDQVMSVTFGRPPAIPKNYMCVPLPAMWPSTQHNHHFAPARPQTVLDTITEFFGQSVKLYQIMGDSVAKQYKSNLGKKENGFEAIATVQSTNEMKRSLCTWAEALPPYLHLLGPASQELLEDTMETRMRTILTLRYHSLNILIHRPLLCGTLSFLSSHGASWGKSPPQTILLAMAEAQECVQSAQDTINIVHRVLSADRKLHKNLGMWFFTLYYVFTACLVVYGWILWNQYTSGKDCGAGEASRAFLVKAIEALQKLDDHNPLVQNCMKFIHYLLDVQNGRVPSEDMARPNHDDTCNQQDLPFNDQLTTDHFVPSLDVHGLSDFLGNDAELSQFFGSDLFDFAPSFGPYLDD